MRPDIERLRQQAENIHVLRALEEACDRVHDLACLLQPNDDWSADMREPIKRLRHSIATGYEWNGAWEKAMDIRQPDWRAGCITDNNVLRPEDIDSTARSSSGFTAWFNA